MDPAPSSSPSVPAAKESRLPGLDGLRGLAILLVLSLHSAWVHIFPKRLADELFRFTNPLDSMGVPLFFVLSGFLITHLLLQAERKHGAINLGHFWLKRAIRIGPPVVAYVAFVSVFGWLVGPPMTGSDIFLSLTLFLRDIFGPTSLTSHFWSLAIESQFYLVWPLLLAAVPPARRLALGCLLLAAFPLVREVGACVLSFQSYYNLTTILRFDFILAGCLIALSYRAWADIVIDDRKVMRLRLIGLFLCFTDVSLSIRTGIGSMERGVYDPIRQLLAELQTAMGYAGVGLILISLLANYGRVSSILNCRLLTATGLISYSLYVWQQFFMYAPLPLWLTVIWVKLPVTFLAGWVSYRLLERPFSGVRKRLTV
jgi:peptidoglycan/LPS O-acetylase OafA/YrhL